ncbi:MAG: redoxin domain-containing protein [Sphingobacteriales bacterium]|nr:MAG: redoxin domain-containing protein [Sphingobacteriales bacterium]
MFKKITLLGVLAVLCLNFSSIAQSPISAIKPNSLSFGDSLSRTQFGSKGGALKVGDKLPESFWQQKHTIYANGQTTKQTLEKYKNTPFILDFWATWCSTCIYKFSILAQWQESTKGQLGILLVNSSNTKDKEERVAALLEGKRAPHQQFKLPSVVNDTYLDALFPHQTLPHYIWIDATGTVSAITNADFVTLAQLHAFLQTNPTKP